MNLLALQILIAAFTVAVLTSCAHIPDKPVCVEISMVHGFCTNTVSDKDFDIDEKHPIALDPGDKPQTWWEMRPFMVLLPMKTWAAFKEYIIESCKRNNCDQYVQSWDRKLNEINPGGVK